jgi:hypothetical protein
MSLLKQAIVDAANLKEAALKNAEQIILEKYSNEIKSAVDTLLEEEGMESPPSDPADPETSLTAEEEPTTPTTFDEENLIPPSYMEGEAITSKDGNFDINTPDEGDTIDINISPEELAQFLRDAEQNDVGDYIDPKLDDLESQMDDDQVEVDLSQLADLADEEELGSGGIGDDELDINTDDLEGLERMVAEALDVDYEPKPTGHAGAITDTELETAIDMALAKAMSDEAQEENEELQASLESLEEEAKALRIENRKFKAVTLKLKDKLEESIVTNAKLLYSNRVLITASLNERQKKQIVEALTNAHSVEEARTIYETLQNTVASNKPAPQSLGEAINRQSGRSSTLPRRAPEKETLNENALSRMKRLAGIVN